MPRVQIFSGHYRFRLRSLWHTIGWALVLTVVYLSLTPQPIAIPVEHGDKIGHLSAYAVLMVWFAQLYRSVTARCLLAVAFGALGIALEFAQLLTDTRTFEYSDMVADSLGVALGWLVAPPRTVNVLSWIEVKIFERGQRQ